MGYHEVGLAMLGVNLEGVGLMKSSVKSIKGNMNQTISDEIG